MNLFENLQMMKENNDAFEIGKNIPVIVALGGGNIDNLKFTINQMSDNGVEKLNALLSDLSKYKLDNKDIVIVDKGNVNGENQKYYKTVNAALNDAVLLKRHDTELGKSALYNYNGKTFLRIQDDEFGIDVYNLPKELFNELIKTESPKIEMGMVTKSQQIEPHTSYNPTVHTTDFANILAAANKINKTDSNAANQIISGICKVLELDIRADLDNPENDKLKTKTYYWKNYVDKLKEYSTIVPNNLLTLFSNLVESINLKESNNEFVIKLPCEYMTDDEIKEYTNDAKNYSVGVQYKINGDDNSFIIISGSPENVKKYIDKEYLRFKDVVDDYEDDLRRAYIKYNNDASEDEIDNFLYESKRLNEMLSESKFKQPSRIKFTSEKLKQNNKLFDKISIQAELLLDNNGEYIACLPGTKDWADLIKEILDANIESIGNNI